MNEILRKIHTRVTGLLVGAWDDAPGAEEPRYVCDAEEVKMLANYIEGVIDARETIGDMFMLKGENE